MRKQLDCELIPIPKEVLRVLSCAHTGRSTSQNNSSRRQGSSLGQEADKLWDIEDKVRKWAVLRHFAVLKAANVQLAHIGD